MKSIFLQIYQYKKLLIATGSSATELNVSGEKLNGVYTCRTVGDADKIRATISSAKETVIIGSGFIALELAEVFASLPTHTTVIIRGAGFFEKTLGSKGGKIVADFFKSRGVEFKTKVTVESFNGADKVESIKLSSGEIIPADAAIVGIGQTYLQPWMTLAGIKTAANAIKTNEYLETNLPDVFAAGDVAAFYDPIAEHNHHLGSWLNAQLHGIAVGASLAEQRTPVKSSSFYRVEFGNQSIIFIGELSAENCEVIENIAENNQMARYFVRDGILIGAVLVNQPRLIQETQAVIGKQYVLSFSESEPVGR